MSDLVADGRGLARFYGEVTALDRVDLAVEAGEVHGLVGANGAGKSTLLSLLLGLVEPHEGEVRLFGRTRAEAGPGWLDGVAGMVEAPSFYPYLSGRRNLLLLARLDALPGPPPVDALLDLVGLSSAAHRRVRGYSLGMRQRLGVAAALLRRPGLLVVDEPTNGLDPAGVRDLRAMVRRLAASGVAVLLSSHDMAQVNDLCDRVTVLHRGRSVFTGTLAQAREQSPDPSWRLVTSDDARARELARGAAGVSLLPADTPVVAGPGSGAGDDGGIGGRGGVRGEGMLRVSAAQPALDAYVIALGRSGVAVRELSEEVSALEALLLRLTDAGEPEAAAGAGAA